MKKLILILGSFLVVLSSCEERTEKARNSRGIPGPEKVEALAPVTNEEKAEKLKEQGYQTYTHQEGDSTYLMQQYYIVFLKAGKNRSQDSTEAAELQKQHLAHFSRMAEEGYASLIGPFGDDGEIKGMVVFNTPTQKEADSLANLDPMVKAGRLKVEIHPWWAAKGGKLN